MTQQRYAIRLADGTLAETEGEIDTWTTRGDAEEFLAAAQADRYIGDDFAGAVIEIYSGEE